VAIIQAQEQFYVLTFAVRRACVSAVPTGWISVMFDIEIFMEICREFENLDKVVKKTSGILSEDPDTSYCLLPVILNRRNRALFKWSGSGLLE